MLIDKPNITVKGTITCLLKSGRRFTYRVHHWTPDEKSGQKTVIGLLTGPNNKSDYVSFGFVESDKVIFLFKKRQTEAFRKHAMLLTGKADEHVKEWWQEGCCRICGRKLTTPESLKAGIGPVCSEGR